MHKESKKQFLGTCKTKPRDHMTTINEYKPNSKNITHCQICASADLKPISFLGYLPLVNDMPSQQSVPVEQPAYPAQLVLCETCSLVQLRLVVDQKLLFPPEYPYTSSTTKILRDNFAELYQEVMTIKELEQSDLVIDIGSNDGNLLSNFTNHKVLGVTPEDIGNIAIERGIPTIIDYFNKQTADTIKQEHGSATIITATNVFAHIDDVNHIVEAIISLLKQDGIFISESHYLLPLIKNLQYDTIYHEHLRYYSLHALKYLLEKHDLEIFHAKEIPTHGGSIRVYAARKGTYQIRESVTKILDAEKEHGITTHDGLKNFNNRIVQSRLKLLNLLNTIKQNNQTVVGIGAPSRSTTLINYVGLSQDIMQSVMEIKGSHKIGKYMPGTLIPVIDETNLYEDQPDYALLLSWHIAQELMPKIKQKGYKGKFIIPLPEPKIVE